MHIIAYRDKLRREQEHQPIQLEIPVPMYMPPEPAFDEEDEEKEPSRVIVIQL